MGPLELFIVLLFWVGPSCVVAWLAARRGQNPWLILVLGLAASWVVSLIVVLLMADRTKKPGPVKGADLERIAKLSELRASGALSDEEFEVEKRRALADA